MPRRLFLKIFLWFLAVLITVMAGTFIISEVMRPERRAPPNRRPLEAMLAGRAQTAAEIFERDGRDGLVAQLDRTEQETGVRVFLFNTELEELSGRRIPSGAPEAVRRVLQSRRPELLQTDHSPIHAEPVTSLGGTEYVFVAAMPPGPPSPGFVHPVYHLLAVALVGAAFCFWLATYLTSPITKLRKATQELASGNLSVRVVPALGNRRDELASLGADFDLMAEQIESLINSQRRLLGDISHELRSPLARLNVALELARQRSGPETQSALERIQREAENLNAMIGQLLALTRLESGPGTVEGSRFDLAQLVREIADDADFEAQSRNRRVVVEEMESVLVNGNYELLRRAIENVVRNAVQYTKENTAVEVAVHKTVAEGKTESGQIKVRDHGAGVPDRDLEKIFQPFYRVDDARDREAGGVGLGLAIAERAIRLHGGKVKATNVSDGGLLVSIELPDKQTATGKQQSAG